jgi:chemotaxis protein methyltransferase CheR
MTHADLSHLNAQMSAATFDKFKKMLFEATGVIITDDKCVMVENRLRKRLAVNHLATFEAYYNYTISKEGVYHGELQKVIDLLTTHKTSFFREPQHFDFIMKQVIPQSRGKPLSVWSSACSSGEEVYSIALCLSGGLGVGSQWSILGSDISVTEVEKSKAGVYFAMNVDAIPTPYQRDFDLFFDKVIHPKTQEVEYHATQVLKNKLRFQSHNLISSDIPHEKFDLILCRNVLIYFDHNTRKKVVEKLLKCLNPGGYLMVSRTETLSDLASNITLIDPSIVQKGGG